MIDLIIAIEIAFSAAFAIVSMYIAISNVIRLCALAKKDARSAGIKVGFVLFMIGMAFLPAAYIVVFQPTFFLIIVGLLLIGAAIKVEKSRKVTSLQMALSSPFYNVPTLFHALYTMLVVYILNGVREKTIFRDWAVETYYKVSTWLFVGQHALLLLFFSHKDLIIYHSLLHITAWIVALYPSIVIYDYMRRWI